MSSDRLTALARLQATRSAKMPPKVTGSSGKASNSEKEETPAKGKGAGKGLKRGKKPIKKVSAKRAKQNKAYTPILRKFLKDNPTCAAELPGCTGKSEEVHHSDGRRGDQLLKIEDFRAVCRNCHRTIHDKLSAERAKKIGMKK